MPIFEARTLQWADEAACARTACSLAARVELRSAYIELHGGLGAGKTTFVRHLLRALGVTGNIKSPTYAVLESYQLPCMQPLAVGSANFDSSHADVSHADISHADISHADIADFAIFHFDFYRFNDPQEFEDAGFREVFANPGLKLAEWPERAAALLPPFDLRIDIAMHDTLIDDHPESADTRRQVRFQAGSPLGVALLP